MQMNRREPEEIVDGWARAVIGAAIEVHRTLGAGLTEAIYEEALVLEMGIRGIPVERQKPVVVMYKGRVVGEYRLDLVVADCLVVELKTVEAIGAVHRAQILSYLYVTELSLGLLFNFRSPTMKDGVLRVVRSAG